MAEVFECHDKSSFEIFAYSHGPEDRSELSVRLRRAFHEFVDLREMTDTEAAKRIKSDRIDILVELKGYTKGARTGIAAQRPAPLQVSFVGFPGTMGASFIDYVIADPFVLPMSQQPFYTENIVHLPALLPAKRQQEADFQHRADARRMWSSRSGIRILFIQQYLQDHAGVFWYLDAPLDRYPGKRAVALGDECSRQGQPPRRSSETGG